MMTMVSSYTFARRKAMAFSCVISNMLVMEYKDAFARRKEMASLCAITIMMVMAYALTNILQEAPSYAFVIAITEAYEEAFANMLEKASLCTSTSRMAKAYEASSYAISSMMTMAQRDFIISYLAKA